MALPIRALLSRMTANVPTQSQIEAIVPVASKTRMAIAITPSVNAFRLRT